MTSYPRPHFQVSGAFSDPHNILQLDLFDADTLRDRLRFVVPRKNRLLQAFAGAS